MTHLSSSELILNPDNSIYHLKLRPEHIADTILLVGDQDRVYKVAEHFDTIDFKIQRREFKTVTGTYGGNPISVISTGIGTDNIDIVVTELDALVNIDLEKRRIKEEKKSLRLVRLGTCGSLHDALPIGDMVFSEYSIGLDGVMHFYQTNGVLEEDLILKFTEHLNLEGSINAFYAVKADDKLNSIFKGDDIHHGITITANGFYGPQGRSLRLDLKFPDLNDKYRSFSYKGRNVLNYEMESSALAGLGKALGHQCATICTVIANRAQGKSESKHADPINHMIATALDRLFPA